VPGRDQLDAVVERSLEPQRVDIFLGYAEQQRNMVVRAHLGERAGRVSGRRHDEYLVLVFAVQPAADRVGLRLFERAGRHARPDFGKISVESDIQVLESQTLGEFAAAVGDRSARSAERPFDRQPVGKAVDAVFFAFGAYLFRLVDGPDQRGDVALLIFERPTFVVEDALRSDVFQLVPCGVEIFHWFGSCSRRSVPGCPGTSLLMQK
jgi:hypothetical protein